MWGWAAGEGGPNFWPGREAGGRTQAPEGCCCGCHGCCCCCWWLGGREGCANPECPQKSGELEAPRSPRGGGGAVGEGGGVPQPQRRAPLRSPHPHGLPGRPGPSARQGAVGGVGGGDRVVEEVRGGRVAGTGEEWQREPPGTVSDCCVPRAPGGLGERRCPAWEFGNGQRRAASEDEEGVVRGLLWVHLPTPGDLLGQHPAPPTAGTHDAWARLRAPETGVAAAATAAAGGAGEAGGPGRGVRHAGGGCCW